MRRAHKVDTVQAPAVAALRACGIHVAITSGLGGGFPDVVTWDGKVLRLGEFKAPSNKAGAPADSTPAEKAFARLFPVHIWVSTATALYSHGIDARKAMKR